MGQLNGPGLSLRICFFKLTIMTVLAVHEHFNMKEGPLGIAPIHMGKVKKQIKIMAFNPHQACKTSHFCTLLYVLHFFKP